MGNSAFIYVVTYVMWRNRRSSIVRTIHNCMRQHFAFPNGKKEGAGTYDTQSWEIDRTVVYRFPEQMSHTRLVISTSITKETPESSINEVFELYFRSANCTEI